MEINKAKLEQLKKDHEYLLINNIPPEATLHFREYRAEPIYVRYVNGAFNGWNGIRNGETAYEVLGEEILKYSIIEFTELLKKGTTFSDVFIKNKRTFKKL